jgi:hypothetical protein
LAPPLGGSEWVSGSPERLAKIVLHGLMGPIKVRDKEWDLHMAGLGFGGAIDDQEIAAILTFVRRAWGNHADPVATSVVSKTREAAADRKFPGTGTDGSIVLTAKLATVLASRLRYHDDLDILGPWVVQSDAALWHLQAPASGRYQVQLLDACDDKNAGNEFVIETDLSQLKGKIGSTGGFDQFKEVEIGAVDLKEGTNRLLMRPAGTLTGELVDLRLVRLKPMGEAGGIR